jgi:putative MATE family efflux protein
VSSGSDIEDPEGAPALPSGSLAAAATAGLEDAPPQVRIEESTAAVWRLAWPVTTGLVLVSAVNLIDVFMVGRLGPEALAAVGYATQFHFLSQSVLFAVGFACVALMARALGAGDVVRARQALAGSLVMSVLTAVVIVGAVLAVPRLWLSLLAAEPAVAEITIPYLNLVLGSSVMLAVAMAIENGLRADKDTRTPMFVAAAVGAVKIGLNFLLIFGWMGFPRLELVGAGLATFLSQGLGVLLFLVPVVRARSDSPLALRPRDFAASRALMPDVVRLSLPGLGERLAMNLGLLTYFRVLAEYGTVAIAAYSVGIRLLSFSWLPGSGIGAAASTLVGHALGSGDPEAASRIGWRATRLAVVVAIGLGIACGLAREPLARFVVDDAATVAALAPFLLCLAWTQPFLQAHFALGGAHRGAGDTFTPFLAATAGNWALRVPLACLFAFVLELPLVWVWYALVFDHVTRTVWLSWSFRRGAWRHARA